MAFPHLYSAQIELRNSTQPGVVWIRFAGLRLPLSRVLSQTTFEGSIQSALLLALLAVMTSFTAQAQTLAPSQCELIKNIWYTQEMLDKKLEGVVEATITLGGMGKAKEVTIEKSDDSLLSAAVKAGIGRMSFMLPNKFTLRVAFVLEPVGTDGVPKGDYAAIIRGTYADVFNPELRWEYRLTERAVATPLPMKQSDDSSNPPADEAKKDRDSFVFVPVESEPMFDENYLRCVVQYPETAQRIGLQGKATIRVYVDANGYPQKMVTEESDHPLFEESAKEAIGNLRFRPAVQDGKPTGLWMSLPITYALH